MSSVLIGEILAGLMFVGIIGTLLLGFPVAFSLAGTALLFGLIGNFLGVFASRRFKPFANIRVFRGQTYSISSARI